MVNEISSLATLMNDKMNSMIVIFLVMMMLLPRKPLFPGQYEVDQLGKIFEVNFVICDDF